MKESKIGGKFGILIGIIAIVVVGIAVTFFFIPWGAQVGKYFCMEDSDCVKVCEDCDCCCGYYTAVVNRETAARINFLRSMRCVGAPLVECSCFLPITEDIPACVENKCSFERVPDCISICKGLGSLESLERALERRGAELGIEKTAEELWEECGCSP